MAAKPYCYRGPIVESRKFAHHDMHPHKSGNPVPVNTLSSPAAPAGIRNGWKQYIAVAVFPVFCELLQSKYTINDAARHCFCPKYGSNKQLDLRLNPGDGLE